MFWGISKGYFPTYILSEIDSVKGIFFLENIYMPQQISYPCYKIKANIFLVSKKLKRNILSIDSLPEYMSEITP